MISRFIKNNLKIILAVVVTAIICISGAVFATGYFAKDIIYKDGKNVEEALNDLYSKLNNIDNYDNKTYTQEGLSVYDNRAAIVNGGYYIDENGITWVNISFKFSKSFSQGTWLQIYGLPNVNDKDFIVIDTTGRMPFRINTAGNFQGKITYIGQESNTYVNPVNTVVTLQFKY